MEAAIRKSGESSFNSKKKQLLNELFRLDRKMMKAYLLKESLDLL